MSQFSSNETASLEKQIENGVSRITKTKPEDLNRVYEIETCLGWIKGSNYKKVGFAPDISRTFHPSHFLKVCLQFPDHLLPDSTQIALVLESLLQQTVYVMADTAYERYTKRDQPHRVKNIWLFQLLRRLCGSGPCQCRCHNPLRTNLFLETSRKGALLTNL